MYFSLLETEIKSSYQNVVKQFPLLIEAGMINHVPVWYTFFLLQEYDYPLSISRIVTKVKVYNHDRRVLFIAFPRTKSIS